MEVTAEMTTEMTTSEFTPRAYQIDLYEKAVDDNIIVYLPTGAGKTYIAVMLLKKLSSEVQMPYSKNGKRSIFIVNTVALVRQQTEYVRRHTCLTCKGYSGDMKVDNWKEDQWLLEYDENQVLVMTAQIFIDTITRGYMKLNRVNLIVFDECHRAVNNHPMRQIMQLFENYPKKQQPRILAMSATLLNANIKSDKIESTIKDLEITFQAKVATVQSIECIQEYCTNPRENIIKYDTYVADTVAVNVNEIIEDSINILKNIILDTDKIFMKSSLHFQPKKKSSKLMCIMKDITTTMMQTGIYGGNKSVLLHLIQLEYLKKYCDNTQTNVILEYLITQIIRIRKLFEETMKDYTELERIYKFSSDQINKLLILLKDFNKNKLSNQKFCCIIFVKERFTTRVLYYLLKTLSEHDDQYSFLLPDFIIGYHNSPYKNTREILCFAKWQKEVMQRFKKGLCNCIVATDVVDEGIDVPLCALVIRYDLPTDYRAYVQSKGRARHGTSHYTVLVPRDDDTFLSRYKDYKTTELIMKTILIGNEVRSLPTDQEIEKGLYQYEVVSYCLNNTGNILTENTVVNILNKYCNNLLRCKFVTLVPVWTLYENANLFQVSIQLPSISPLKDVVYGDPMANINVAKRSAAMKCCIRLHQLGALTDNIEPVRPNAILKEKNYLFPNWQHEDDSSCGTHKKKRRHEIEHPTALYEAFPYSGEKLYLHILHVSPTYSVPHDNRHLVFYNLLNDKSGFGILSTKSMPKIPSFPIFMNVGELNVAVKPNYTTMTLNEEDIKSLKIYHTLLFSEVIPVIKKFMVFDKDNLENSFLIVPLNVHWEVNWDDVRKYQQVEKVPSSTLSHVRYSDYEVALVNPSYRASPSVYIVTQVCDDLTPKSLFPTDDFETYMDYYEEKHGIKILNLEQPLLEVKAISTKINCIRPRSMKPGLSKRRRADVLEDFEEHLIPELCRMIYFPALYWLKASTLPSILHRITQLLIAEDLRATIVRETGLGIMTLPSSSEWPALDMIEKEIEQSTEPLLDTTLDDTVESTQTEPDVNEIELDVMNTESNLCPWQKDQEPQDIFRDIEHIQIIDVQYYCNFMLSCDEGDTVLNNLSKNINYISKPIITVPPLHILAKKHLVGYGPSPAEIMQALTTKICHDAFNLERLETLGDSYLKFITSLFLYHSFPELNEGQLTAIKGKIIGNRNLYYSGVNKSIPGRMKIDEFAPMSTFIVPAYTIFRPLQKTLLDQNVSSNILYELLIPDEERLTGDVSANTNNMIQNIMSQWSLAESQTGMEHYFNIQIMPDKSISDSVEALIGVYLRSTGISGAAKLLQWFGILPDIKIDELLNGTSVSNPIIGSGNPNEHMPWANSLEKRLGYKFNNRAYLLEAFTHPSYSANRITECYQRLEFLGDAILDFLITCHIYESCGNLNPGALTDLRSALVNNITFACLAVRYGLHTCLLAYAPQLHEIINRFVKFQEERNYAINDELLWVLLEEEDCNMAEYIDVPKVLGDLFETLIGAIYIDSNRNLVKVWEIVYSFMHREIDEFSRNVPKNPVRVIHEHQNAQAKFLEATLIEDRHAVMIPLKVNIAGKEKVFHGFGTNKKLAKYAAAKQALKRLRSPK